MTRNQKRRPARKGDLLEVPAVTVAAPRPAVELTREEKAAEEAVQRMVEAAYT